MSTEVDNFLAHYGVKGMKWGVRRGSLSSRIKGSRLDRNQRRTARFRRVAEGRGSLGDKVYAANRISSGRLITEKGLKGAAARRVSELEAKRNRIEAGKSTLRDILDEAMLLKPEDLLISRQDARG